MARGGRVIWLNGAFGVGKSTAMELADRIACRVQAVAS
jgi:hypothetical protein